MDGGVRRRKACCKSYARHIQKKTTDALAKAWRTVIPRGCAMTSRAGVQRVAYFRYDNGIEAVPCRCVSINNLEDNRTHCAEFSVLKPRSCCEYLYKVMSYPNSIN
jgi:hypothetical protein